jgi:hypothetical protein
MKARVEQLALRFRLPTGAPRVHAQLPSIERSLHAQLADEIAAQLEAIDERSDDVIVIREATACVTLRVGEGARQSAAVEHVSRAAREAVTAVLARPSDDEEQVRRFSSDAAYIGTFVVELLDGTAWGRWYFEGFQRFRRTEPGATLVALLADVDTECMALFAWLERRGRLAAMLELIGPTAARSLASTSSIADSASIPPADLVPLAAAAFAIAESLGVQVESARQSALLAEYQRFAPARPQWVDRGALTEWVWQFTRWIVSRERSDRDAPIRADVPPSALVALAGRLDWLDAESIMARVSSLAREPPEARMLRGRERSEQPAAPRHAAQLREMTDSLRSGAIRVDLRAEPHDQLLLRLIAALHTVGDGAAPRPDYALVAVLDSVLNAAEQYVAGARPPMRHAVYGAPTSPRHDTAPEDTTALAALDVVRAHGAKAVELLRALLGHEIEAKGDWSRFAGIFLLTRPITDMRLHLLAVRAGVPWEPLLMALAVKLFGIALPLDEAIRLWVGSADAELGDLQEPALHALQLMVLQTLADQQQLSARTVGNTRFTWRDQSFDALSDASGTCWPLTAAASDTSVDDLLAAWRDAMACDPEVVDASRTPTTDLAGLSQTSALPPVGEVYVTSLATCVLRAMSRWLPGLGGSSAPFLIRNCIARAGTVTVIDDEISVVLDRGPLDVVLEMAGCFAPMTSASWLGRSVRFSFASKDR